MERDRGGNIRQDIEAGLESDIEAMCVTAGMSRSGIALGSEGIRVYDGR